MKLSSAVVVLSLTGTASAYSVSRSSIRNLGQKTVQATGPQRSNGSTIKMEGTFYTIKVHLKINYSSRRSSRIY